jgi:hypothetical protein
MSRNRQESMDDQQDRPERIRRYIFEHEVHHHRRLSSTQSVITRVLAHVLAANRLPIRL